MLTPDRGLKCKAFLSVGHDEYWDIRQFRSVEQMRDAGVNLLFLSGNAVCWVTPLRAEQRRPAQPDHVPRRPLRRRQRLRPRQRRRSTARSPSTGPTRAC